MTGDRRPDSQPWHQTGSQTLTQRVVESRETLLVVHLLQLLLLLLQGLALTRVQQVLGKRTEATQICHLRLEWKPLLQ